MRDPGRRRRRLIWGAAALCVAGGAAGAGAAAAGASGASYRTAEAVVASVESTLTLQGKAEPVDRATVDFGASGTVSAVDVSLGQSVTAGETIATLSPTSLQRAVTADETTLDAAQAKLASDEEDESSDDTSASDSSPSSGSPSSSTLSADQAAVVAGQKTLDADEQTATAQLITTKTACGTSSSGTTGGTGSSPTGSTTTTTTPGAGASSTGTAPATTTTTGATTTTTAASSAVTTAACESDLSTAASAESTVADDEKALTKGESALAAVLSSESGTGGSGSGGTGSGTGSGGSSADTTKTVTAATLADDQESIDQDQADLLAAEASLAAADLVSPISGTVVAVNLTVGESVTAGSSSDDITVASTDSYEATATLSATESAEVAVGDHATVSVVGASGTLSGSVTRVGPVDVTGGNTYPLVISLPAGASGFFTGTTAQISVVLKSADDVLTVPTSAVHTVSSGRTVVDEVEDGTQTAVSVKVGVVGNLSTQITSGLENGDTVILADVTEAVPASNTTSTVGESELSGNSTFGSGGFPGGGSFHPNFSGTK